MNKQDEAIKCGHKLFKAKSDEDIDKIIDERIEELKECQKARLKKYPSKEYPNPLKEQNK